MVLRQGPTGGVFLMSEVPLYRPAGAVPAALGLIRTCDHRVPWKCTGEPRS